VATTILSDSDVDVCHAESLVGYLIVTTTIIYDPDDDDDHDDDHDG
jgi:hypothetical protein